MLFRSSNSKLQAYKQECCSKLRGNPGLEALMFQAGQLLPEEDNLMSPLPMRQLNSSNANLAAKSGTKRITPAAIDPGKTPCHILQ